MARPRVEPGRRSSDLQVNVAPVPRAHRHKLPALALLLLLANGAGAEPGTAKDLDQEPGELRAGRDDLLQAVAALEATLRADPAAGAGAAAPSDQPAAEEGGGGNGDLLDRVSKAVGDITKEADKVVEKVADQIGKTKPLMNRINSLRAQLCWTREDLWSHEECLEFLGLQCDRGSTGAGVCNKFKEAVQDQCKTEESRKERKVYCGIAKKLGIAQDGDAQEETEQNGTKVEVDKSEEDTLTVKANATASPDRDGDGRPDEEDAFPDDPSEWSDLDGDGIGDNKDEDIDGDGQPNDKDKYPRDSKRWTDDQDGDGRKDEDDAFPNDPKEWSDLDEDGIGDNSDDDIDGDGVPNEQDIDPFDASKSIADRDGDGHADSKDAFPDDPKEWKDRDGDGVGDNGDAYPDDPNCWRDPCKDRDGDGVGDDVDAEPDDPNCWEHPCSKDAGGSSPGSPYNKVRRKLPSQGYDEHSKRWVEHKDQETWTRDWRAEWPRVSEQEMESILRICKDHPSNIWCQKFRKQLATSQ